MSEKQKEKLWKILNTVSELSLCIVVISGIFIYHQMANKIVEMQETIDKQSQQIQELASFNRYSLASHKRIKEAGEITESSTAFKNSDYFINNKLEDNLNKNKVFNITDTSYYVLFYTDTCSHCNELESDMFDSINIISNKTIYFYDANAMNDDSGFVWDSANDKESYKTTKKKYKLAGTPSLVKVNPNSKKITVFVGTDAIEKELKI